MSWGEIYNTSWWGVALDTARTVKARPDFFGSQLNLLTSEQPNLVVNGTFDTDSNWSFGTSWSMGDGVAISDGSGSYLTDSVSSGFINGKKYRVSLEIVEYNSGSVSLPFDGAGGNTNYQNSIGVKTAYITAENNTPIYIYSNNFDGTIDNVSVQVVRAELDQIEAKKCLADWIHTTALKDLNN